MSTSKDELREREEWVKIGILQYDAEAEIVSSLFESASIPLVVQGRNHRRMMGFLGGQVVELRLLAPRAREAEAQALLADYITQRDRELNDGELDDDEEPPRLLFNQTGQKMGVALLLATFLGFGLASLSAGAWVVTLILAPLQVCCYWSDALEWGAQLLHTDPETLKVGTQFAVRGVDLLIAWTFLVSRARFAKRSGQTTA